MDNLTNLNELDSISMDELQSQLITWVQEKGLLNELRAYLRKKMIFLLKDTILDQKTCVINQLCVTPKLQAISLLVAEYLLSQQLFYSLSVFSTEVPTITHVNKFCQQIQNSNDKNQKSPKLDTAEIIHILEAIGVSCNTKLQERIIDAYVNATDRKVSLLSCISEAVSDSSSNLMEKKIEKCTQGTNTDEQFDSTRVINTIADLNLLFEDFYLKKYQSSVFTFMEKEQNRVKAEERARYRSRLYKQQKNLYQQMKIREECVLKKLSEAESSLLNQKQQIEANLKNKQGKLQELADELNIIHAQLMNREAVVQEAVLLLKNNSKSNLCEKCESAKKIEKKKSSKTKLSPDSGDGKTSQENGSISKGVSTNRKHSETACERKLFSDIILGLQQENASLRDQTLRHQSSIIKLRAKLAKKKSCGYSRQSLVQQLYVPLPDACRPCNKVSSDISNHTPKTSPIKEKKASSKTSVKSEEILPEMSMEGQHLMKSISSEKSSSQNTDKIVMKETQELKNSPKISSQGDGGFDFIRPFIPERITRSKPKSETGKPKPEVHKQKSETRLKTEARKIGISQENSEKSEKETKLQLRKEAQKKRDHHKCQNSEDHQKKIEDQQQKIELEQQIFEDRHKVEAQETNQEQHDVKDKKKNQQEMFEDQQKIEVQQEIQEQQEIHEHQKIQDQQKMEISFAKISESKNQSQSITTPDVHLETNKTEIPAKNFKDIAKKMKPLEDALYSKRVPNIYFGDSYTETSHHGDRNQNLESENKFGEAIRKDMNLEYCCSKSTYDLAGIKFCKLNPNLKKNESDESFKTGSSKSSLLPRNRKHRKSNVNIEDVDENDLFRKVCSSLGVPFAALSKRSSAKSTKKKQNDGKYKSIFEPEGVSKKNKNVDLASTLLDESSFSTCSDNSRDCKTPDSLIFELDGTSL